MDRTNGSVDALSGGQAQRVMICRALMHRPRILFLDEPSTGLDPQVRLFLWDRVRMLRGEGVAILLTTHDMDGAAVLSDRVGIMDHGRVLGLDTPAALVRRVAEGSSMAIDIKTTLHVDRLQGVTEALRDVEGIERVEVATAPRPGASDRPTDQQVQWVAQLHLHCSIDPALLVGAATERVLTADRQ